MMNASGIKPMEYNVLVKPSEVEKTTKGGLILADSTVEKEEFGRMEGTLVATSPMAFSFAEWPEGEPKPKIGDRVLFSRYQATELTGRDGGKYWMMKDKSIMGVME
jgi:co-chaperonin GroES (HSP10)